MRLDKYLANQGFGSRKDAKKLIKDKRIKINGVFAKKPEDNIDPKVDKVSIDDEIIDYKENYYFMLYKPKGYISATEDNFQNTVLELIPEYNYLDIFPVGRLDKDTTGLLLLTTDGDLAHKLISPKKHVDKIYIATLNKNVDISIKEEFESGIILDDELTLPAKLEIIDSNVCKVTLHQGKYHQVKRMFEHFGYKVIELHREQFAFLTLDGLKEGEYRELTDEEIFQLKSL
jgi:16S rRNA pseudouridine516 synthase